MNNKLLVVRRPGQTYYEIRLDQPNVPSYIMSHVVDRISRFINPKYFIIWAGKTILFVDSSMFDALRSNGEISYKDEIIIL